jgi:CDP-diacylglycerol--serine O-phosphatidyltransferase
MLAMLAGFLSILLTLEGMRKGGGPFPYYRTAAQLIMLAMILDGLDGNLARMLKGESEFGAELDTYVDLTAFGLAPAVLIFAVTLSNSDALWRVLLPSAVAVSGVVRLARFKVMNPQRGQAGYAGLPITANAAWVALFVFISRTPPRDGATRDLFSLEQGWFAVIFLVGIVVFITLQVTHFQYPKPTKKAFLFIPCIVLVALLWILSPRMGARVAAVMICLGMIYVVVGPMFSKRISDHRARKEADAAGE